MWLSIREKKRSYQQYSNNTEKYFSSITLEINWEPVDLSQRLVRTKIIRQSHCMYANASTDMYREQMPISGDSSHSTVPFVTPHWYATVTSVAQQWGGQGGQSPGGGSECRGPGKKLKIFSDLPNNADIVLSPAQNLQVIRIHNYLYCMGVLCTWVKQNLQQIFGCELHKNVFGGWALPGPAGEL